MTQLRIHDLDGAWNIHRPSLEPFVPIIGQCGVRFFLQCVCIQLIVFLFDRP